MTFDDDHMRLHLEIGAPTIMIKKVGLEWPPPERIWIDGDGIREATDADDRSGVLLQIRRSQLTDEQRAGMQNVARGAEYFYELELA